jgi:hypothetical protein
MYIERSLERGYKREDIGISHVKVFRIKLAKKINELKLKLSESGFNNKNGRFNPIIQMF